MIPGNKNFYWLILLQLLFQFNLKSQYVSVDSLRQVLKNSKEDTSKVNSLNQLAQELQYNSPDTAILLAEQAKKLSEKINFDKGIAKSFHHLGTIQQIKGNFPEAIVCYGKAIQIFEKLEKIPSSTNGENITLEKAKTLGNFGVIYADQSNFPKALEYYFKALRIFEKYNDRYSIAVQLSQIGNVYFFEGEVDKALDYHTRALHMDEELKDYIGISFDLGNLGNVFTQKGDFRKALAYYYRSMNMNDSMGNKSAVALTMNSIGAVYLQQNEYGRAMEFFRNALNMEKEFGSKAGVATNLGNMGMALTKMKKYEEAESCFKNALMLADTLHLLKEKSDFELEYSKLETERGRYQSALEHYKLSVSARDSVTNEENTRKNTQAQLEYEFSKKEAATQAEQEKKDALASSEQKKQRIIRNSFIAGFVLVLLMTMLVYREYRNKQKANLIISKQKEEVERAKSQIEQQKLIVEEKQKEILDSIYYAKRIQQALMASEKYIGKSLGRLSNTDRRS